MKKILSILFILLTLFTIANNDLPGWSVEYGKSKSFVKNEGQFDKRIQSKSPILFAYDGGDHNYYFTKEGVIFELSHKEMRERTREEKEFRKARKAQGFDSNFEWQKFQDTDFDNRLIETKDELHALWVGSNSNVEIVAEGKDNFYHNYSFYNNSNELVNISKVPSFQKLVYKNVYPNIDAVYEFHPEIGIKYSLVLHPGADPTVVQLNYSKNFQLQSDGKIKTPTVLGDIIDHEPLTFYANNSRNIIQSKYRIQGNSIYFELSDYDKNQTVVIDPWTQTPNFNTNWKCVWECERDAAGNVYIIGGVMPLQLIKYDNAGNQQWVHNTPYDTTMWLGTFATDDAGNSYVSNGSSARIQKISPAGTVLWNNTNPGGLFTSTEFWNITFNCDQTKLVIGGTGGSVPPVPYIYEMDMNSGNVVSSVQIHGSVTGGGAFDLFDPQEIRSITPCDNGRYYFLTHDSIGYIHNDLNACGGSGNSIVIFENQNRLGYKCENFRYNNSGIMALAYYDGFIYLNRGNEIQKRDFYTSAILATAPIPGGVYNTQSAPIVGTSSQIGNSGIDIDECGNIYVGSTNGVYKFDQNLSQLDSYPTTYNVYDVHVNSSGDVIACGSTGNSSNNNRTGTVQSFSASACSPTALVCCDAAVCPVDILCVDDSPITLTPVSTPGGTWAGNGVNASGVFNPASAGIGEHEITYTLPCGVETIIIKVSPCEPIEICANTDGTISASNGIGPYTWQAFTPASSSPINNQTSCEACGYDWIDLFLIQECLGPNGPVSSCDIPAGYQTIDVANSITPGSLFPITVTDSYGNEGIINSQAELDALPECTTTPCPTINVTIDNQSNVLCNGETNGAATVSASGGSGPYTYSWSPGNLSGATQNNLSAQTYTVSVSDADDCPGTIDVVISEPTALSALTSSTEASCGEEDGSASITVSGGTGAYTYQWDPDVSSSNTATNLGAGSYDVTITDENNCELQETILVNNQNAPVISVTETIDESCSGAADGSATIEVSGGTGAYTYSWDPSGGTGPTATNLSAGDYTVTVTDEANCSASATVSIATTNEIVLDAIITDEDCGQQNGQIQVTASGGTGVLSYSWDSGQNSSAISNLPNGSYTITIEDEAGCSISATYDVGVIGSLDVTVNPVSATIEAGQSIDINAEGGFTYTWSPETGLSCTDCPNPTASPTTTTTYTVVAIDENGCAGEADVTIFVEAICGEIFVPTIFSPNSDNLNDRHCVLGGCISEFELIIYNRWGERVFVSRDASNCWDGIFRGKPVQTGVYVYKLKATLVDGTVITDSGNINVVK